MFYTSKIRIYKKIYKIINISFILSFKGLLRTTLAPWKLAQYRPSSLTSSPRLPALGVGTDCFSFIINPQHQVE